MLAIPIPDQPPSFFWHINASVPKTNSECFMFEKVRVEQKCQIDFKSWIGWGEVGWKRESWIEVQFLAVPKTMSERVTLSLTHSLITTHCWKNTLRDLCPLTCDESDEDTWPDQKKAMAKTMTMTKTMTKTFREHPQRVILETYDPWDIWSERWGDMT